MFLNYVKSINVKEVRFDLFFTDRSLYVPKC